MAKKRLPGLPPVPSDSPPGTRRFLADLREALAVRLGQQGDPLEQVITRKDMVDWGLASLRRGNVRIPGDFGDGGLLPPAGQVDYSPPPAPTGLTTRSGFDKIFLEWDDPKLKYNYGAEIFRSTTDALELDTPGGAVKVGGTNGTPLYVDNVDGNYDTHYYWVRYVRTVSNRVLYGPFNQTAGTPGSAQMDYEGVRDSMAASVWAPDTYYSPLESVVPTTEILLDGAVIRLLVNQAGTSGSIEPDWSTLVMGSTVVDGTVTWEVVDAGRIPFFIDPTTGLTLMEGAVIRNASIDNATIKDLAANKLFVDQGTIAQALIGTAHIGNAMIGDIIQSNNYVSGSSGWILNKAGTMEALNGTFRGRIEADTGYIASTLQIGGTTSTLGSVKNTADDAASTANNAKSRTDNWVKPGYTTIDGNKIYTGDAYVDTLQIKGQAVTFPRGAYTGAAMGVGGWATIQSIYMEVSSAPLILIGAAYFDKYDTGNRVARMRILVDGAVLAPERVVAESIPQEFGTALRASATIVHYVSDPGSGGKTFSLQASITNYSGDVSARSLIILEAKR